MTARPPITRRDLEDAVEDVRGELGIKISESRAEWRDELKLRLGKFTAEMRLWMIGLLVVLKFDVPKNLTVGTLAVAGALAVGKAVVGRFSS